MLHGSETWRIIKKNEVALQQIEMRIVRWMCGIRQGLDDIISILQQNRLCYGHVMRKEDNDWVKKCIKWRVLGQEVDQRKLGDCGKRLSGT